jgi:hypothetical protein
MENEHEEDYFLSSVGKISLANAYRKYAKEQSDEISNKI